MDPIDFHESNFTWRGNGDDVVDLRVHIDYNQGLSISCWEMPFWERVRFLFSGKIWLRVWSAYVFYPVSVGSEFPFVSPDDLPDEDASEPLSPHKCG